jgi:hypothetical protein
MNKEKVLNFCFLRLASLPKDEEKKEYLKKRFITFDSNLEKLTQTIRNRRSFSS